MKSLTRLFVVFCACNALALIAFAGPEALPSGKEMKEVAPMPPPPCCNWTGFYIGINAGGIWSTNDAFDTDGEKIFANPAFPAGSNAVADALAIVGTNDLSVGQAGFIGGGQIGGNFQFAKWFVVGLEADFQGIGGTEDSASQSKTTALVGFAEHYDSTVHVSKSSDSFGTVRARLGFLVTPCLLAYATGGVAYGGVNARTSFEAVESLGNPPYPPIHDHSRFSNLRGGWAAGGGLEWLFKCHWGLKVEDLYYDLGSVNNRLTLTQINLVAPGGPAPWGEAAVRSTTWFNGNIARVGLNFHF